MTSTPAAATSSATDALTDVILLIFRVNGQLLAAGDDLIRHLNLTSARWQMLGAIGIADCPCTAPQLAAAMGMTRQGAQKQLDLLVESGFVMTERNPRHARSPLYVLTQKGASVYAATERVQRPWATQLACALPLSDLRAARRVLDTLSGKLTATQAERSAKSPRRQS
jgi:DNA-binding MarR family transcriptional regulator